MNRIVLLLLVYLSVSASSWAQTSSPSSTPSPALAKPNDAKRESGITDVETITSRLKNSGFTVPAPKIPIKGDVVVSGEKASDDVSDIKIIVVAYGKGTEIFSMKCIWLAVDSKTNDGKAAGLSMGEWRSVVCGLIRGRAALLDDWITRCLKQFFSQPGGEMVTQDINVGSLTYEFSGSVKSAMVDIEIFDTKARLAP